MPTKTATQERKPSKHKHGGERKIWNGGGGQSPNDIDYDDNDCDDDCDD